MVMIVGGIIVTHVGGVMVIDGWECFYVHGFGCLMWKAYPYSCR